MAPEADPFSACACGGEWREGRECPAEVTLKFKSQICYFVALQPQFPTHKVGIMTHPPHRLVGRIKSDKAHEGLGPVPAKK